MQQAGRHGGVGGQKAQEEEQDSPGNHSYRPCGGEPCAGGRPFDNQCRGNRRPQDEQPRPRRSRRKNREQSLHSHSLGTARAPYNPVRGGVHPFFWGCIQNGDSLRCLMSCL
jgi:hypothetical protein